MIRIRLCHLEFAPFVVLMLFSSSASFAQEASLSFNFSHLNNSPSTTLQAGDSAGVFPARNWNNLPNATGTRATGLVYDLAGTATPSTASITWSGPNTWLAGANNKFPIGPNRTLFAGYLDSGSTTATGIRITVTNLDPVFANAPYDVYVYFLGDTTSDRGGAYTITDTRGTQVKYGSTMANPMEFVRDPGHDRDLSYDGNYLHFIGLGGNAFTLSTDASRTDPNGFRAPVTGIQIVPTTQVGPEILVHPRSREDYPGDTALFSVAVGAAEPVSYRWQKLFNDEYIDLVEGARIGGVTSPILGINGVYSPDAGDYRVLVSNSGGIVTSLRAVLRVSDPPPPPPRGSFGDAVINWRPARPLAYWRFNDGQNPAERLAKSYDYVGGHHAVYGAAAENGYHGVQGPQPSEGFPVFEENNLALRTNPARVDSWATAPGPVTTVESITFVAWINPVSLATNAGIVFMRSSLPATGLNLHASGNLGYTWRTTSETITWNSGLTPPLNQWSMVAAAIEPAQATLYLLKTNGIQKAVNYVSHAPRTLGDKIHIGADYGIWDRVFDGRIDEVALFDGALTEQEIENLYFAQPGGPPPRLSISFMDGNLQVRWANGGVLQSTTELKGPATDWETEQIVGDTMTVAPTGEVRFFRVIR